MGHRLAAVIGASGHYDRRREESAIEQSSALVEQRLAYGETALHRLYAAIGLDPEQKAQQEREHIFDKAANKVCRQCTRYSTCWERNAQSTYQALRSALGTILDRGEASGMISPRNLPRNAAIWRAFWWP